MQGDCSIVGFRSECIYLVQLLQGFGAVTHPRADHDSLWLNLHDRKEHSTASREKLHVAH